MSNQVTPTLVWSRSIRFFHWVNVVSIVLLLALGLVIFYGKALGVSQEGKVLLKVIHVVVGYVFAVNLCFRLFKGFWGKGLERWSHTLPFSKGYRQSLREYQANSTKIYQGHNPVGKLMVAALLLVMSIQMISGLVLAGTDIYYPPFGQYFAKQVAEDKTQLEMIKPYSKENVNAMAYQDMRAFRKPFITAHIYAFYALLLLIPLHIIGVVCAERKTKTGLTSAMITGYKYLPEKKE